MRWSRVSASSGSPTHCHYSSPHLDFAFCSSKSLASTSSPAHSVRTTYAISPRSCRYCNRSIGWVRTTGSPAVDEWVRQYGRMGDGRTVPGVARIEQIVHHTVALEVGGAVRQ